MDKKKLMLLLGALVVAIGTALAARSLFMGASAPQADAAAQQVPKGPKVLVAQRALPVGTIITTDSVAYQSWPKDMVQDAYYIEGEAKMADMLGTVVRYPITAGEPVTQGSLVSPGDRGFLAAALGPGMRAVTIPVSAKTGVAGFVFPGDRVDLMLTQTVKGGEGLPLKAAETILRNVRVLATDQSTETTSNKEGKTVVRAFRTVTLEVTPRIAEKVSVAQTLGTISLSLRSIADNQSELERAVASGDVKVPEGATKEEEERILRQAMNRPAEGTTSFVTGGDVSRFARRDLPKPKSSGLENKSDAASFAEAYGNTIADRMGLPGKGKGGANGAGPAGPVVRVSRGKVTSEVEVGAK